MINTDPIVLVDLKKAFTKKVKKIKINPLYFCNMARFLDSPNMDLTHKKYLYKSFVTQKARTVKQSVSLIPAPKMFSIE